MGVTQTSRLDGAELDGLWTFDDVPASERRLRAAVDAHDGPCADELRTQVARALGLQQRFDDAHAILDALPTVDPVVAQRVSLERGRLFNTFGDKARAREEFAVAHALAADEFLTVDALHMLAIADRDSSERWTVEGLAAARASADPRVQRWEGSLLNNQAWNLADAGRESDALDVFREAEAWFAEFGSAAQIHVARWSVAHLLRRVGRLDEARAILVDLKASSPADRFVDEELAALDGE